MEVYEYVKVLRENGASAATITVGVPNPGHTWSSMECNANTLCIDTTNGLVGVGTNSPAVKLDVNGAIKDRNTDNVQLDLRGSDKVCFYCRVAGLS